MKAIALIIIVTTFFKAMAGQMIDLNQSFGGANTKENTEFTFKNFRIRFLHIRKLTEKEINDRNNSVQKKIEGGHSIKADFYVFEIRDSGTGELVDKIELSRLPFGNAPFKINGNSYQLRNSDKHEDAWIVIEIK